MRISDWSSDVCSSDLAWYGKGPGVDRTGDVFKHGNLAGSARNGGVLVIAGDDHICKSSTTAHQSEYALMSAMIPVLEPSSISEQMELGLIGWEMYKIGRESCRERVCQYV